MGTHGSAHPAGAGGPARLSVAAELEAMDDGFGERAAEGPPPRDRALDVVLRSAKFELAAVAPHRPRRAAVTVERHSDTARIDQVGAERPGAPELDVAVPEHDRPIALASDPTLVLGLRLAREAVV